jgi:phospholipid/cholesterol/gamma-HCH transport system substrate-binding protein
MRPHEKKNILKVGMFISALTAVLMVFVISIGKESSLFEPKTYINAYVKDVSGLKTGSYVQLKGLKIGNITKIEFQDDDKIHIQIKILEKFLNLIKEDATVAINNAGLVGDKYLEIVGGSKESKNLKSEGSLYDGAEGGLNAFMKKGESIAEATNRVLARLDSVLAQLEGNNRLANTLTHMEASSVLLSKILKDFDQASLPTKFSNMTGNIEKITHRINKGPGTLNSLIYDDSLHDEIRTLLGGAQRNKILKYFINESMKEGKNKK